MLSYNNISYIIYIYIYIYNNERKYIYINREREREREVYMRERTFCRSLGKCYRRVASFCRFLLRRSQFLLKSNENATQIDH